MNRISEYTRSVSPLCFEIVSDTPDAEKHIQKLHQCALDCDFVKVSHIIEMQGEECLIGSQDPYENLKIRSRKTVILPESLVVSLAPTRIIGFQAVLPNRCILTISLSSHPGSKEMVYQGFVQTVISDYLAATVQQCVRSHRSVVKILDNAKSTGILRRIIDPTLFWDLRDETHLRDAIARSQAEFCGGLLAH